MLGTGFAAVGFTDDPTDLSQPNRGLARTIVRLARAI